MEVSVTRRGSILCVGVLLFAIAACGREKDGIPGFKPADRTEIERIIEEHAATARRAWILRDAALMVPEITGEGAAEGRADLQRKMDKVMSIDTLSVVVDSICATNADKADAYSTERFVRVVRMPDGTTRRRFSTVQHVQTYARAGGSWTITGTPRSRSAKGWWEGEAPPK
jgi:hypothetical protein